ncbi:hypothetical protein BO94DRAFT_189478 [Aspergillus sclerotioniger CBS 115572]|uniref:DUF7624 domain-containing protein n=1 Tax=Aspergillus sclerotioniger CBS 115572 TaxID=1450535 RepID=A0A317VYU0_9EURO|nr:hypothetical protein BO94DRAFT_189478 [Aspergillus sclerotioniger CBS 115572]PWY78182.1 hypothetical protein BO94DRAFT_189478 [Aspergillus sclerotioniger CBS 115572]
MKQTGESLMVLSYVKLGLQRQQLIHRTLQTTLGLNSQYIVYKIQTTNAGCNDIQVRSDDDEPPQSVIHAPAGFGNFLSGSPTKVNGQQCSNLPSSSRSDDVPSLASNVVAYSYPVTESEKIRKRIPNGPTSPPPLTTSIQPANDWCERPTPRAQTRQDFLDIRQNTHSVNQKEVNIAHDHHREKPLVTGPSVDGGSGMLGITDAKDTRQRIDRTSEALESKAVHLSDDEAEIAALRAALAECWALCNTLATLSCIHRERHSYTVDTSEDTWKSCWRLCQVLYDSQSDNYALQVNPTLDLCKHFCQTLFETRVQNDEGSDSVLRVSFELNNHLYNTHDRKLPDAFRERTLDFYITLCHRLMKQRTLMSETDTLLSACWSLAEMLFSIRQSIKERKNLGEELLGSAVQACWELCDIFREGWTSRTLRSSDRGTPRPSQATFMQAFQQTKQPESDLNDEFIGQRGNPETPTTIFDDTATVSPDDAPVQNIFVLGESSGPASHATWSSNSSNISGKSQASEQTSSTRTVKTSSKDPNLTIVLDLVTQAAINSGFQDVGQQSFSSFVKSLSSDAFGSMPWQVALLKNYKRLVAFNPAFRSVGPSARASAADVASAVTVMVQGGQYPWLRDLYRLVFGFHIEEAASRKSMTLQI